MKTIFLWLCISIITFSSIIEAAKCNSTEKCNCIRESSEDIEYWCLGVDAQLIIEVYFNTSLRIICDQIDGFGLSTLSYLKNIKTTPTVERFSLKQCPVPEMSIFNLLEFMGVHNITEFIFESFRNIGDDFKSFHFKNLTHLDTIYLWSNQITELPDTIFEDVPKLKKLYLNDNNLTRLSKELFRPTPNLNKLELGNNNLATLNGDEFKYIPDLVFLSLYKNDLKEIRKQMFIRTPKISNLDLNSNEIVRLEDGVFDSLEGLEHLNLNHNHLKYLPENLFAKNKKLKIIKFLYALDHDVYTLPSGLFANLTNLNHTIINYNNLKYLPENLFENCYNMQVLALKNNSISTLPGLIFRDTIELRKLDISDNKLEYLNQSLFSTLKKLTSLHLENNRLTYISSNVFFYLKSITEMDLSGNLLTDLEPGIFAGIKKIEKISLKNNKLTLRSSLEFRNSPFKECTELRELNLRNNSLSIVFDDWRYTLTKLNYLDLSYNNLTELWTEDLIFTSGNYPIQVNLNYNQIHSIHIEELESRIESQCDPPPCNVNSPLNRGITIFSIKGNPVICDCVAFPLANYLQNKANPLIYKYIKIEADGVVCQSPNEMQNKSVAEIDLNKLTCSLDKEESKKCPENCTCNYRFVDRTIIVNCNKAGLFKYPEIIPQKTNSFVELLFAENNLNSLNGLSKLLTDRVTKLSLSYNKISDIDGLELPKSLKVLELDNNQISSLSKKIIQQLNASVALTTITLFKNPWHCNCDTKDFSNFLRSQIKYKQIPNHYNITCKENGQPIVNLSVDDLCKVSLTIIVTCVCLAVFGLLSGAIIALYYIYEHEIKVWMFAHKICLWLVAEKEIDKNKIYDAFVSFSTKDQAFVVGQLMPQLEQYGEHRYKLCIHFRDFIVGEWIPNQIINSVENSRRTIIVLSPNFLDSVWARMEFRTAHLKAIQERCARVIVILLSDIDMDKLDPELKAYITMNTYVKWGDPLFWEKIRYALPHPQVYSNKRANVAPCSGNEFKKQQKLLNLDEIYKAKV